MPQINTSRQQSLVRGEWSAADQVGAERVDLAVPPNQPQAVLASLRSSNHRGVNTATLYQVGFARQDAID
jgi:hypothetical protein